MVMRSALLRCCGVRRVGLAGDDAVAADALRPAWCRLELGLAGFGDVAPERELDGDTGVVVEADQGCAARCGSGAALLAPGWALGLRDGRVWGLASIAVDGWGCVRFAWGLLWGLFRGGLAGPRAWAATYSAGARARLRSRFASLCS